MSYKRPKKIKKIKTSQSQTVGVKMPLSVVHLIWNHPSLTSGNCVFFCFDSEFTNKINKITNKTNKMTKIFAFLSVLYVILLIFFVNLLLKNQSTQLPAMKTVISHEYF
jgi:hydrogenase maturation factor